MKCEEQSPMSKSTDRPNAIEQIKCLLTFQIFLCDCFRVLLTQSNQPSSVFETDTRLMLNIQYYIRATFLLNVFAHAIDSIPRFFLYFNEEAYWIVTV